MSINIRVFNLKKHAQLNVSMNLENKTGPYGEYQVYIFEGNTYPVKDKLKSLGFKYKNNIGWYMYSKYMNENIKNQIRNMGITINGEQSKENNIQDINPEENTEKQSIYNSESENYKNGEWITEEEPSYNGRYKARFPLNKNIVIYDTEFQYDDNISYTLEVHVDRSYTKGKSQTYGKEVSIKQGYNNKPNYLFNIYDKSSKEKIATITSQQTDNWGTYNEEQFILEAKDRIDNIINNPQKRTNKSIRYFYKVVNRDEDLKNLLENISGFGAESKQGGFNITIDEPSEYADVYDAAIKTYGGESANSVYIVTNLDTPNAPREETLATIDITDISSTKELVELVTREIESNQNIKEKYLKYLQSFPFLQEQKDEADEIARKVMGYFNGNVNITDIFNELKTRGFVHVDKRSKPKDEGLQRGEDYKWILNSKKITESTYKFGYISRTPEFFYIVVAYATHRKKRGIRSWTDMMLMDSIRTFVGTMKKMGIDTSIKECEIIIDSISDQILDMYFQGDNKNKKWDKFTSDFFGDGEEGNSRSTEDSIYKFLSYIKEIEDRYQSINSGFELIPDNVTNIYRSIIRQVHPDKQNEELTPEESNNITGEVIGLYQAIPELTVQSSFNLFFKKI